MALPPLWKVYRELDRSCQALHAAIARVYEPIVQRRHDRNRDRLLQIQDGRVAQTGKIALFLVFQPKGLRPTVLQTCAYLVSRGYAPLVISNAPLQEADLQTLIGCAWKILVRPNYGYDFGGYRDGVLWLHDQGILPERLMILNDSIWFPVWPGETLIDRMEAAPADFVGAVIHPAQKRRKSAALRPAFLESYLYIVNQTALRSPAFYRFWQDFKVSSIKFNAVYRGERSFSHRLEQAGLIAQGIFHAEVLDAAIRARDVGFLRKVLDYGAYTDPDFQAERDALLARDSAEPDWRAAALAHIHKVIGRRSSYASFPYASFHLLGVPFLKKSRLTFLGTAFGTVQIKMRTQLLRAIDAGDLPPPYPEVLAEIRAIEPPPPPASAVAPPAP